MVLAVQAHGCRQPLSATITFQLNQPPMKWSHTFEDGDKALLPMLTPAEAPDMKIYLKAELEKNGDKVHFMVLYHLLISLSVSFLQTDWVHDTVSADSERKRSGNTKHVCLSNLAGK